jgi:hypothetical protein
MKGRFRSTDPEVYKREENGGKSIGLSIMNINEIYLIVIMNGVNTGNYKK